MDPKGNGAPPPLFDGMSEPEAPAFQVVDRRVSQMSEEELEDLGAADVEPAAAPSYIEQLEQQLERAQQRLVELQSQLRSELAEEVESTRRRLEREAEQQAKRQRAEMAAPMLEVLEALERSISVGAQSGPEGARDAVLQGVEMVRQLMLRKLGELGLERIETVGQRFDPTLHEAIGLVAVDDPAQDGMVISEVTPGFALGGQVMRAPRVQVGRLAS